MNHSVVHSFGKKPEINTTGNDWIRCRSTRFPNLYYFYNVKTSASFWDKSDFPQLPPNYNVVNDSNSVFEHDSMNQISSPVYLNNSNQPIFGSHARGIQENFTNRQPSFASVSKFTESDQSREITFRRQPQYGTDAATNAQPSSNLNSRTVFQRQNVPDIPLNAQPFSNLEDPRRPMHQRYSLNVPDSKFSSNMPVFKRPTIKEPLTNLNESQGLFRRQNHDVSVTAIKAQSSTNLNERSGMVQRSFGLNGPGMFSQPTSNSMAFRRPSSDSFQNLRQVSDVSINPQSSFLRESKLNKFQLNRQQRNVPLFNSDRSNCGSEISTVKPMQNFLYENSISSPSASVIFGPKKPSACQKENSTLDYPLLNDFKRFSLNKSENEEEIEIIPKCGQSNLGMKKKALSRILPRNESLHTKVLYMIQKETSTSLPNHDLRHILRKKKEAIHINIAKDNVILNKENPETTPQSTSKDSLGTSNFSLDSNDYSLENTVEVKYNLQCVRRKAPTAMRTDIWYIVVDLDILLTELTFMDNLVKSDPTCRMKVPYAVHKKLHETCAGAAQGRSIVLTARKVVRYLVTQFKTRQLVEGQSAAAADNIADYRELAHHVMNCTQQMIANNFFAIILSNDELLHSIAKTENIPCYSLDQLKEIMQDNDCFANNAINNNYGNDLAQSDQSSTPKKYTDLPVTKRSVRKRKLDDIPNVIQPIYKRIKVESPDTTENVTPLSAVSKKYTDEINNNECINEFTTTSTSDSIFSKRLDDSVSVKDNNEFVPKINARSILNKVPRTGTSKLYANETNIDDNFVNNNPIGATTLNQTSALKARVDQDPARRYKLRRITESERIKADCRSNIENQFINDISKSPDIVSENTILKRSYENESINREYVTKFTNPSLSYGIINDRVENTSKYYVHDERDIIDQTPAPKRPPDNEHINKIYTLKRKIEDMQKVNESKYRRIDGDSIFNTPETSSVNSMSTVKRYTFDNKENDKRLDKTSGEVNNYFNNNNSIKKTNTLKQDTQKYMQSQYISNVDDSVGSSHTNSLSILSRRFTYSIINKELNKKTPVEAKKDICASSALKIYSDNASNVIEGDGFNLLSNRNIISKRYANVNKTQGNKVPIEVKKYLNNDNGIATNSSEEVFINEKFTFEENKKDDAIINKQLHNHKSEAVNNINENEYEIDSMATFDLSVMAMVNKYSPTSEIQKKKNCKSILGNGEEICLDQIEIKNETMTSKLILRMDEWVHRLVQIMEDTLMQTLRHIKWITFRPPWTFFQAVECVKAIFRQHKDMVLVACKLSSILRNVADKNGGIKSNLSPVEFIDIFSYSIMLIKSLMKVKEDQYLEDGLTYLTDMLREMEDPNLGPEDDFDETLDEQSFSNGDDFCENKPIRNININKNLQVEQYLLKHYPLWKNALDCYENRRLEISHELAPEKRSINIIRTSGRNLKFLKLYHSKLLSMTCIKENKEHNNIKDHLDCEGIEERKEMIQEERDTEGGSLLVNMMDVLFSKLSSAFLSIRKYIFDILKIIKILTFEQKKYLHSKTKYRTVWLKDVIVLLNGIIQREAQEGQNSVKALSAKVDFVKDDVRFTRYSKVIMKIVEQAGILEESLVMLATILSDENFTITLKLPRNNNYTYFNIFDK